MRTLVVINGESDWQHYLAGYTVHHRRLQASRWLLHDDQLWVFDASGSVRVEGVLWRVGAIKPHPSHRTVLELIRRAQIPCVNPAAVLLRGYDRISMLNELREASLPVADISVALGEGMLDTFQPDFPAVVKVGNYHGGYGKACPRNAEQWTDIKDLTFVTDDYVTVEQFIDYTLDIRCLAVGEHIWAMARRGKFWKANTETESYEIITVPSILRDYTERAMTHFGADILGLDFLQTPEGGYLLLESNDTPGLDGFPDAARVALATLVRARIEG